MTNRRFRSRIPPPPLSPPLRPAVGCKFLCGSKVPKRPCFHHTPSLRRWLEKERARTLLISRVIEMGWGVGWGVATFTTLSSTSQSRLTDDAAFCAGKSANDISTHDKAFQNIALLCSTSTSSRGSFSKSPFLLAPSSMHQNMHTYFIRNTGRLLPSGATPDSAISFVQATRLITQHEVEQCLGERIVINVWSPSS